MSTKTGALVTWSSRDGGQELEGGGGRNHLGPLGKMQLPVCQQGYQGGKHLWWCQIQVFYDQPLALCHSLHTRTTTLRRFVVCSHSSTLYTSTGGIQPAL